MNSLSEDKLGHVERKNQNALMVVPVHTLHFQKITRTRSPEVFREFELIHPPLDLTKASSTCLWKYILQKLAHSDKRN